MFIISFCLNMFRASLCPSSGDQRPCFCIWCTALVLLDVVGSGCGALRCRMWALWRFLFWVEHGLCSPEDRHNDARNILRKVNNKHLIVASCWFFLSFHTLLTMHCHRSLKLSSICFEQIIFRHQEVISVHAAYSIVPSICGMSSH